MNEGYDSWLARASAELGELLLASEDGLPTDILTLDKGVLELVRGLGKGAVAHVYNRLAVGVIEAKKAEGFRTHRNGRCSVRTVLGVVDVTSPYLIPHSFRIHRTYGSRAGFLTPPTQAGHDSHAAGCGPG